MLTLFIQQVLNGLLDGVYYLLIALGLSLIFSLGGIVNLAHGAFYAIGAYLTIVLAPHIGGHTLDSHVAMQNCVVANLTSFFEGRPLPYAVKSA